MPNKRVIYYGFEENRSYIVNQLHKAHDWLPIMFVGWDKNNHWSKSMYPSSKYLSSTSIRQGQFDYEKFESIFPVDELILKELSRYFSNVLGLLEDTSGWNYSYFERRDFYYHVLCYWNTVINETKPDVIVWPTWPHSVSSYTLYLLAKHCYSIDVIFIDPIPMLNKNYHFIGTSLEEPYAPFYELYSSSKSIEIGDDAKEYISISRKGITPKHIIDDYSKSDLVSSGFRWKEFMKMVLSSAITGSGFRKSNMALKKNKEPYWSKKSLLSNLEYFFYVEKIRNNNRKLRRYYDPLCVKPDLNKKYIYYAGAYQPEARTNTLCGLYEDQFLSIEMLHSVLPKGWVIYYKENNYTFDSSPWAKGSLRRDENYFNRLNSYENLMLVSTEVSTFELIDSAQVIATTAGTVAWEAAVRGKPALTFGSSWYAACKSIFRVHGIDDLRKAIEKILSGYKPDQKDIERYVAAIENVAVKGMLQRDYDEAIEKSNAPELELDRIVAAIIKAYKTSYSV